MLKSVKMDIKDLYIGLYVNRLDRAWLGTPFLTQGFFINSNEDIEQLGQYCDYVLVDSTKSRFLGPATIEKAYNRRLRPPPGRKLDERPRLSIAEIFSDRSIKTYQDKTAWEDEQPRAQKALDTLIVDVNEIFSEVVDGGNVNVLRLRQCVMPIVDSITRNPDACLWVSRLKQHDEYTYQHSLGCAIWSVSLGRQLGLPRHDLRSLAMGCMLMDVGKLRLDPKLLQANRELSTEETAELASHVNYGLEILQQSTVVNRDIIDIVAHHHERHDGSGYPNGLTHHQIPTFARIAAIVDTYDAITSKREYAEAFSPTDAIKLLYSSRDMDFQAELVEAFIQAIGIYPAGTLVELSSGEVAVVVAEYRARRLRPKVMILLDANKNRLTQTKIVDLKEELENKEAQSVTIVRGLDPNAYGIDLSMVKF